RYKPLPIARFAEKPEPRDETAKLLLGRKASLVPNWWRQVEPWERRCRPRCTGGKCLLRWRRLWLAERQSPPPPVRQAECLSLSAPHPAPLPARLDKMHQNLLTGLDTNEP